MSWRTRRGISSGSAWTQGKLEFPDGCFDSVTAFYFLMYLFPEDMGAVFSEAARVLKSGGRMYIWDAVYDCAFPEPHLQS